MNTVSFSAATACGDDTACHDARVCVAQTSAAIGSNTTRLRYAVLKPTDSICPPLGHVRGSDGASALAAKAPLDRRHDARARIEELLLHSRPSPDVADREELLRIPEVELLLHGLQHRPVARLGEERLCVPRVEELDERLRFLRVLRRRRHG